MLGVSRVNGSPDCLEYKVSLCVAAGITCELFIRMMLVAVSEAVPRRPMCSLHCMCNITLPAVVAVLVNSATHLGTR